MELIDVLKTRRSIRKFGNEPISAEQLKNMIDMGRYAPQASNVQPVKYAVVNSKELCDKIFPYTRWAGLLGEKGKPSDDEAPTAYIIVMTGRQKGHYNEADAAFVTENIVLAAWNEGIASCILASIDREKIAQIINKPDDCDIVFAIALGYPKQESIAEDETDGVKYYLDAENKLHVPKRRLDDVMYFAE